MTLNVLLGLESKAPSSKEKVLTGLGIWNSTAEYLIIVWSTGLKSRPG